MSSGIHIGNCKHCNTEAYMTSLNEVSWMTPLGHCEKHELKLKSNGEERVSSPISSRSMSFTSESSAVRDEGRFPTENEAKYCTCLRHVKGKCGFYVKKYEDDLTNVSEEYRRNEEEIEKQFLVLEGKLAQRKKDSLDKLYNKKIERENALSDLREKLILYEDKCSKAIQEMWQITQSQEETPEREKQCEKIAKTVALEIPLLYSFPYTVKFDPKDMTQIATSITSCGLVVFTELDRKRKIQEFCWRESDRQWLQPSSASASVLITPKAKAPTERPEIARNEYHGDRNGATEFKYQEDLGPGSNYDCTDCDTDSVVVQVKHKEENKSITIPKQEWTLPNLQKRVVEAFALKNPAEALSFKVNGEEDFNIDAFDHSQTLFVAAGETSSKSKKEKKLKLFINNSGKRTRLDLPSLEMGFEEFKENVKSKIKESTDTFNIQIANGSNRNKMINSDGDMALLACGESQLEVNIIRG